MATFATSGQVCMAGTRIFVQDKVYDEVLERITTAAGRLRCFVTDDPARFATLASRFLGAKIDPPTWVPPESLYAARPAAHALRVPA